MQKLNIKVSFHLYTVNFGISRIYCELFQCFVFNINSISLICDYNFGNFYSILWEFNWIFLIGV